VRGSGAGTVENVKPAGQYRVFVRFALLDDVPEPLTVYPPGGVVTDSTQLQGSALAFTVEKTLCDDPVSQTPTATATSASVGRASSTPLPRTASSAASRAPWAASATTSPPPRAPHAPPAPPRWAMAAPRPRSACATWGTSRMRCWAVSACRAAAAASPPQRPPPPVRRVRRGHAPTRAPARSRSVRCARC
jgi:hypothetical protein